MKRCTVSIADGETHMIEVEASSLYDAVDQASPQWAKLWWYQGDGTVDVTNG